MADVQPIPSATVILLRDAAQGIEALIMQRNSKMDFLGGFWVFPGGAVEAVDQAESEAQTYLNAAVRETEEEAGIRVDAESLISVSRWITPEGVPKRFDARFYVGRMDDQPVEYDGEEMTASLWVTPSDAIARHRQGEIDMLPPTLLSLLALKRFSRVEEVLQHYQQKPVLSFLPKACVYEDQLVMLYPGDGGYEAKDPADRSALHRCLHTPQGWRYVNEIGVIL